MIFDNVGIYDEKHFVCGLVNFVDNESHFINHRYVVRVPTTILEDSDFGFH